MTRFVGSAGSAAAGAGVAVGATCAACVCVPVWVGQDCRILFGSDGDAYHGAPESNFLARCHLAYIGHARVQVLAFKIYGQVSGVGAAP